LIDALTMKSSRYETS